MLARRFAAARSAQKTQLTVYTALETDQLKAYEDGFNKVNPNIEIKWVRDSTGVITAKLLAEKANPQADVVMGVAASSLALLDTQGMLDPVRAAQPRRDHDASTATRRTRRPGSAWTCGARRSASTPSRRRRRAFPKPETWKDLTKPIYKGQIVMPNPASSGTGFFDVTAWLTLWGDDNGKGGGWKYMDALHENIAQYTHSGSKPCNMAAAGEYVVGISFEYRANTNKAKGAPIDLVFPKEGLGWDLEAFAHPQGHEEARRGEEARRLGLEQGRDDAVRQELRDHRAAGRRRSRWRTCRPTTRARLVKMDFTGRRREPRAHPRRVEQALQRQVRAEEVTPTGRSRRRRTSTRRCSPTCASQGIRKSFGAFQALRDIDLTIAQGEFVCFLGPSGCGKTTLLRIIAGLETQTAGSICQAGRDISRAAAGRARLRHRVPVVRAVSQPDRSPTTSPTAWSTARCRRRRSRRASTSC